MDKIYIERAISTTIMTQAVLAIMLFVILASGISIIYFQYHQPDISNIIRCLPDNSYCFTDESVDRNLIGERIDDYIYVGKIKTDMIETNMGLWAKVEAELNNE